jgi:hypothetical protein
VIAGGRPPYSLTVNGASTPVATDGGFTTTLAFAQGPQTVTVVAADANGKQAKQVVQLTIGEPPQCPAPEPLGMVVPVYDDEPQNCFELHGSGTSQGAVVHTGSAAIAFDPGDGNQISLSRSGLRVSYSGLRFWIRGGTGGGEEIDLVIATRDYETTWSGLASFISGPLQPGQWTYIDLPFPDPTASDTLEIRLVGTASGDTIYLDDISLVTTQSGTCTVSASASCTDGDACNGEELCDGTGHCLAGIPPVLDDTNPCVIGSCDPMGGLTYVPASAGAPCWDGNACTLGDLCDGAGTCQPGAIPNVDDGNPCTMDVFDPVNGRMNIPLPPVARARTIMPATEPRSATAWGPAWREPLFRWTMPTYARKMRAIP